MAKRFTDTAKWKHPSFRQMPLKARITWLYLLDECDHAGFWLADMELASFQLGFTVNEDLLEEWFGAKLFQAGENRLFIPDFVRFQYQVQHNEDLNMSSKPHMGILKEFAKYGVSLDQPGTSLRDALTYESNASHTLTKGLSNPSKDGSLTVQDKDKDKDKDKERGGVGEKTKPFDFHALYAKYPRKEGKPAGLIQCRKQIRTQADYDRLTTAIERYASARAKDGIEIKFFSSFLGSEKTGHPWHEWAEEGTGTISKAEATEPDWKREAREEEARLGSV